MAFFRKSDMATHPADSRQQTPGGGATTAYSPRLLLSCPLLSRVVPAAAVARPLSFCLQCSRFSKKMVPLFPFIGKSTALHCSAKNTKNQSNQSELARSSCMNLLPLDHVLLCYNLYRGYFWSFSNKKISMYCYT